MKWNHGAAREAERSGETEFAVEPESERKNGSVTAKVVGSLALAGTAALAVYMLKKRGQASCEEEAVPTPYEEIESDVV